jgi:hypothetical protein
MKTVQLCDLGAYNLEPRDQTEITLLLLPACYACIHLRQRIS